jgi:hypothetical protein
MLDGPRKRLGDDVEHQIRFVRTSRNVCHGGVNVALEKDPKARRAAVAGEEVSIRHGLGHHYIYAQAATFVPDAMARAASRSLRSPLRGCSRGI